MATVTEAERYLAELKYAMDYYGDKLMEYHGTNREAYEKYDVARCKYDAAKRMIEIMKR